MKTHQLPRYLIPTLTLINHLTPYPIFAQIVPDATLPTNSSVTTNGNTFTINGGTRAGGNLFHSFQEFSLPKDTTAFFNNPLTIDNIFTRITGSNISQIDGIIRTSGSANLFILNPNGIIFGSNARLDIGGGFFATTASSLLFPNGQEFSANHPTGDHDGGLPLLTINVPTGLQFGSNSGTIINQSRAANLGTGEITGLAVPPGGTLALIGNHITIPGGYLTATAGSIYLGSVADNETVTLTPQGNSFIVEYNGVQNFQDIQIYGEAKITTSGDIGGPISLQGRNLSVTDNAQLLAITTGDRPGRGITLRAADSGEITGINTSIQSDSIGTGAAGNIMIETPRWQIAGGAFLSATSLGTGDGGNVTITAKDSVTITGNGFNQFETDFIGGFVAGSITISDRTNGIFTGTNGSGKSGDINIETGRLIVADGSLLFAPTFGTGNGGNINIRAAERVDVNGSVFGTSTLAIGTAGDINIDTTQLHVGGGALIGNTTTNAGVGGNIQIRATESVVLDTSPPDSLLGTGIFANTIGGTGAGGDITINTNSLQVMDGAQISTTTGLVTADGTLTAGGVGGSLVITASEAVDLSGVSPDGKFRSSLSSATFSAADAGELRIDTGSLTVSGGAQISTGTAGMGNGGNLSINARELVEVKGANPDGRFLSSLQSDSRGAGVGGNIAITTGQLQVLNGGLVTASAFGTGAGGDIAVHASEAVTLVGNGFEVLDRQITGKAFAGTFTLADLETSIATGTESEAHAGNLEIDTGRLTVAQGAVLLTTTVDQGAGGSLAVTATEGIDVTGGALISSTVGTGPAGNLTVDTTKLTAERGGFVTASTLGVGGGTAGNLTVRAAEAVELRQHIAGARGLTGILANSLGGNGTAGTIVIDTGRLVVRDGASVATRSGTRFADGRILPGGQGGNIMVNARESVEISGISPDGIPSTLSAGTVSDADAGTVTITTGNLFVSDGGQISVETFGAGRGGTMTVQASGTVAVRGTSADGSRPSTMRAASGEPSRIIQATGAAGDLRITAGQFLLQNGAEVGVNSFGTGNAGTLAIAAQTIRIEDRGKITASPNAAEGGNIGLSAAEIVMRSGSKIATDAGKFDGGNITIDTRTLAALENSDITANAEAGRGGRVSVTATGIFGTQFREQENPKTSDITATSNLGPQFSGTVEINTPEVDPSSGLVQLPANFINAASLIGRDPCNQSQESEFIITGRGGLPPNPLEALTSDAVVVDWATTSPRLEVQSSLVRETPEIPRPNINRQPIVEATGWIVDGNGEIILVSLPSPASINHLSVVTCSSTNDP